MQQEELQEFKDNTRKCMINSLESFMLLMISQHAIGTTAVQLEGGEKFVYDLLESITFEEHMGYLKEKLGQDINNIDPRFLHSAYEKAIQAIENTIEEYIDKFGKA